MAQITATAIPSKKIDCEKYEATVATTQLRQYRRSSLFPDEALLLEIVDGIDEAEYKMVIAILLQRETKQKNRLLCRPRSGDDSCEAAAIVISRDEEEDKEDKDEIAYRLVSSIVPQQRRGQTVSDLAQLLTIIAFSTISQTSLRLVMT